MKLSLQATLIASLVFALVCFGVALEGFLSLADITDEVQRTDARGFAGFWAFLGGVAGALGLLAWWMTRTTHEDDLPDGPQ